ncbi:GNAT family N-acetyltransferase [Vibrio sp. 10N.261.55.A7]|uniref:GNAT family N-acetyltransferase n=1 Tax=Vibrio sp. 10N.261.55.A7 TaxID=1880851 RepID=UPI000C817F2F|nr:GNAT family N-acetyltransferase [Vibrio sp. 10N.261.55.A7]PMJ95697.1 GNAT family N-acetyltransferase [Vibrio sp. 10N.261.55.A7]
MALIRLAVEDDLSGILSLYKELRGNDPVVSETELMTTWHDMLANPNTQHIVAEIDGQLASTCQLGLVPTVTNAGKSFGIIEHVITSEHFRRRGLSQKVMEKALELAWELNCYQVVLLSGETRFSAHKLYEKVGFQAGIEKGFVIKAPN